MKTNTIRLSFILNNGLEMPAVGLGSLFAQNDGEVEGAIAAALQAGYRKIDTAAAYGNEEGVGKALQKSGIHRSDLFLTTKVWNTEQGYDKTLASFDQSLHRLQTDYVDLYLIHWPVKSKYRETYRAMEKLYAEGRVKAIGVCNFSIAQLQDLIEHFEVVPAVNQVEMHPHLSQPELLAFAQSNQIQLEAWRPIMMGEVLQIPDLVQIGANHGKSAVQVALRWLIQRGVAVIPKSVNPQRIAQNVDLFDFALLPEEMERIEQLNQNRRLGEDLSHIE
ncbi:MAG: aldo/keto reductase [Bacteroidota bacterium]